MCSKEEASPPVSVEEILRAPVILKKSPGYDVISSYVLKCVVKHVLKFSLAILM